MIESVRKVAIDVILDQRPFALDPERCDAFVHALAHPSRVMVELIDCGGGGSASGQPWYRFAGIL
jgi:uncharacterized protein (DUF1778 family)